LLLAAAPPSKEKPEFIGRQSWIEIVAITVLVPLGIYFFHPRDPFLLNAGFPWLVLLPLLMGAQHGLRGAVASSALLSIGAWLLGGSVSSLAEWSAGGLSAGVVSGYCRDRIRSRLSHSSQLVEEYGGRLARLSRAHAVLKLSHQRLEERLSAQSWSLASAVNEAERRLASCDSLASAAQVALEVFFNHAMVQSASLLLRPIRQRASSEDADGLELQGQLGPARSVDVRHPLIERALETGRLVAIDVHADASADPSVLAAVPITAATGAKLGVLVVHEMPFMAFQTAHLKNLASLALYIGDLLAAPFDGARTGTHARETLARSARAC
jgi:hypothetical protein